MTELRRHADAEAPLPAREAQREAHMRQSLRAARKEGFARIAVVCGAWHVPALQDGVSSVKADAALLKGLPKLKVQATWVPWSHRHLARRGYGAGVASPGWYDFLWQHDAARHPRAAGWLAKVATLLRARCQAGGAFVVVEQNLTFLGAVADQILVLDHGECVLQGAIGSFSRDRLMQHLMV